MVKSILTLKQIHHEVAALHRGHEEKNKQKILKSSYFGILKIFFFYLRAFVVKSFLTLKQIHHEAAALHRGHEEKNKQKIVKGSYFDIFRLASFHFEPSWLTRF